MQNKNVLIIGNGPVNTDISKQVEEFDRVVRFNFCAGLPAHLGTKCTDLWLSSRGRQAMKIAQQFPRLNLSNLSQVMLTDPKQSIFKQILFKAINRKGKIDFGDKIARHVDDKQIIQRIDQRYRASVLSDLLKLGKPECKPVCPSSGLLAMHYFIERCQHVTITGFGFQGWKRHPWAQEKQYVDKLVKQGKIDWLNLN
ncbi:glycosyltransferase family 29 protein [Pseudoalteromonas luteoviolacea]|uniref:Uncharacterized protein n=1 Tax=Pseudoalteromonas luteoviolacea S4054 TaxID=1129367 RepID=A0A0F6A7J5_9GAMM|nr:glycosyltransferase family 29 protein [Pseudoalteromonas luteoviolacea]AOT07619.1 hypothetical protein S4054249_07085 [Pseudoalteromonas luteoviolacea]AOT12535.1 hypothetical protein S40542_07085 [Pseudoalteromonas luteoviolacea]AOT17449.1 hypothetical protein S4054_07085 [Pseudoalteromonas luteoviolacea]KKE81359.1 hypothetical protein N479_22760 [Pseudoalteromonas luteoviolacea S4054]KZN70632.1 hypothetical protein N481_20670 [Pseudoalteromonas luteoviolacea S4047-1]